LVALFLDNGFTELGIGARQDQQVKVVSRQLDSLPAFQLSRQAPV